MRIAPFVAFATVAWLAAACSQSSEKDLAPSTSAVLSADKPTSGMSVKFEVDGAKSSFESKMDAPLELIFGSAEQGLSGELFVELTDLEKTTGLVNVDMLKFDVYQRKRESTDTEYGEKVKQPTQNEHADTWLEVSPDAPEAARKTNAVSQFKITKVLEVSDKDVTKLTGAERKVKAKVEGDFLLHGRVEKKTVEVELTFTFDGATAKELRIKTVAPFVVDLEKHDVRPRDAFGQLADKTFESLGQKVDKMPKVSLDVVAKAAPAAP